MIKKIVSINFDKPDAYKLSVYEDSGGYGFLKKLFDMKPEDVIEHVKKSGLRGRGGAGFSAGMKRSFVPKDLSELDAIADTIRLCPPYHVRPYQFKILPVVIIFAHR